MKGDFDFFMKTIKKKSATYIRVKATIIYPLYFSMIAILVVFCIAYLQGTCKIIELIKYHN